MNFQPILNEIGSELAHIPDEGRVAAYIPELAKVEPGKIRRFRLEPGLNKKGNSFKGMKALELLTTKTELSIF